MPKDRNDSQDEEIKVTDRRLFNADGERLERDEPEEAAAPAAAAGEEHEPPAPAAAAGEEHEPPASEAEAPVPSFETLVFGLANAAFIHLGQAQDPSGGEATVDLPAAKEAIDLLGVLQKKTDGNLTPEEQALLESLLFKLRIDFSHRASSL